MEEESVDQRMEIFLNALEERPANFTDEELARLERIKKRRCCSAAPAIIAPIGAALNQPTNPQYRCLEISFDTRICVGERSRGKMESDRGELESSSAVTGLEVPGQQCLSSWEMQRTTVDDCPLVDGSSDLGETTFSSKTSLFGCNLIAKLQHCLPHHTKLFFCR